MGFYVDRVLPRIVDLALRGEAIEQVRREATAGLSGEVLEVGFGSGRNVPHYPTTIDRVRAVDPATAGRHLAAGRIAASPVPVEYVGQDGEDLPLEDGSIDHVLITWTLCTIPDVDRALAEVHRVLRPGGMLRFVEHGRAEDPRVVRWQDRLDPWQGRFFGGCHLNRPIDELVARSGLAITQLERRDVTRPRTFGHLYMGIATKYR